MPDDRLKWGRCNVVVPRRQNKVIWQLAKLKGFGNALVYLTGDNSVHTSANHDIKEMAALPRRPSLVSPLDYMRENLRRAAPARPRMPVPSKAIVEGSGTGEYVPTTSNV
jgi:hypothetical protein